VNVGYGSTVKVALLLAVPPGVVTLIFPVVAPAGTTAWISLSDFTRKELEGTPLKATVVAPLKTFPLMTTVIPTFPLVGVNESICGGLRKVKLLELAAVPAGVVTLIVPLLVAGTNAVISVSEITEELAETSWKVTLVAPVK